MKELIGKFFAFINSKFSFGEKKITEGWKPIDKDTVKKVDFTLQGEAVNYKSGRPYKLFLKQDEGKSVWYAEMQDTGDWYLTEIGQ